MSRKPFDYAVINPDNSRALSTDDFTEVVEFSNKSGGLVYVRITLSPICLKCGDSMIPQHEDEEGEGQIIGWNCGNCWESHYEDIP